jgi:anti-sigma factor ChrR (cupin superfamily)
MNQLVTEARALCRDATEAPWMAIDKGNSVPSHTIIKVPYEGGPRVNIASGISPKTGNAAFIARSRTLLPEMADEIERLEAELATLTADIEAVGEWPVTVGSSLIVNGKRIKITGADYMTQQVTIEWPGCDSRTDQSWPR